MGTAPLNPGLLSLERPKLKKNYPASQRYQIKVKYDWGKIWTRYLFNGLETLKS